MSDLVSPAQKPTVFIGSSAEAMNRGIVDLVIEGLRERFTPRSWEGAFSKDNENTLQTLLRIAREVDAAILVCAHDDTTDKRGKISAAARDNVYMEYGLFLSVLGLDRVSVLWEEGVDVPSDVRGLNLRNFGSDGNKSHVDKDDVLRSSLRRCIRQVADQWENLEVRASGPCRFPDGGAAVARTLEYADRRVRGIAAKLETFAAKGEAHSDPFIRFDSNRLAMLAYAEGLEAVQHRFWTTTFPTSGFWVRPDADVLDANSEMLRRIIPAGGSARRLFLLEIPPTREIERIKQRMVYLRQIGATAEIEEMWSYLQSLRRTFSYLTESKCEVRVAHDRASLAAKDLPPILKVDANDSEIALYDDFRVDVFGGGRIGVVTDVNIFSRAYRRFDTVRTKAESYFRGLWEMGEPGMDFIDKLERAYHGADRRIVHSSNFVALFEYALEREDRELKTAESKRVVELLKELKVLGKIRRYLDIGTCTGRYPRALRQHIAPDGHIVGLDSDIDCVRFSKNHPDLQADPDPRISFVMADFTSEEFPELGQFDLITCMLSTLSHFGVNRDTNGGDTVQRALERTRSLMTPDAVFIFTLYSDQACDEFDLLRIYQKPEIERMVAGTPRRAEIRERLRAAGLRIDAEPKPDLRLDMYVCRIAH